MTPDEIVDRYFDCVNSENWTDFAALWAEDGRYSAVGARTRHGRDEVLGYYRKLFAAWETHDDRPGIRMRGDDAMCVEVHFTGRTRDGRDIAFDAADVFHFRDGKIVALTTWYDLGRLRQEMAAAGPSAKAS